MLVFYRLYLFQFFFFCKIQVLTQILAADEFWAQHAPAMSAAAKAKLGQEAGVSGSFLSDIKPQAGAFFKLFVILAAEFHLGMGKSENTIILSFNSLISSIFYGKRKIMQGGRCNLS